MKSFFKIIAVVLIIVLLAAVLAAAALFAVYMLYLKPEPAEFEFSRSAEDILDIELVAIENITTGSPEYVTLAKISDKDAFLTDFTALECSKGLTLDTVAMIITDLKSFDDLLGIRIIYADATVEVITAYGNIDSDIFSPDFKITDLLNKDFYFFDSSAFEALIEEYK